MRFGFNRNSYKKCAPCAGTGKVRGNLCSHCHGYGSRGLAVIMRSKAATMEGRSASKPVQP